MDVNISKIIIETGVSATGIDWRNIVPAIIGGLIGGGGTMLGVFVSHKNNEKIEAKREEKFEASVVLAIEAELRNLKKLYEKEMDETLLKLGENDYLANYYTATQDFMVIYHENAQNIGKIKINKIRDKIITTYGKIKKFLEDSKIYEKFIKDFNERQLVFLCRVFPEKYKKEEMSIFRVGQEIQQMKEKVLKKDWEWFKAQDMTHDEISYFLFCDDSLIEKLIRDSQSIKKTYIEIKTGIKEVLLEIENNYKK